ncbi:MAG TPA: hypothetical protein VMW00_03905 [Dehalococcoidales bacterium]|nr:hypothetical protein [Dehalococcoidales bacterium]
MVKVGCCGFSAIMRHYFSQFLLVEVQQTFCRLPQDRESHVWLDNITMYDDALRFAESIRERG